VQRFAGIAFAHRYRCACTTKFDILTPAGRFFLAAVNVAIAATVLLLPASRFGSENDRIGIFVVILGIQIPIVAFMLIRSAKYERLHARA
jgi:hypothetical protein